MKRKLLSALIMVLFSASIAVVATSWKSTETEDSSIAGTEILMLENESASGNNWIALDTIKTWVLSGLSAIYEPLKGADDNFVTAAEKAVIGNTSGTNTGDDPGTDDQTAAEVSFTPDGSISATTVQAAIVEVRDEGGSGTDDQTATEVPFTPAGTISATNTQDAIEELDSEAVTLNFDATDFDTAGTTTVTVSLKAGVSQPYDANLPTWPSSVDATEVGYLNGVTSSIQTQISGKQASGTYVTTDTTFQIIQSSDCSAETPTLGRLCVDGY